MKRNSLAMWGAAMAGVVGVAGSAFGQSGLFPNSRSALGETSQVQVSAVVEHAAVAPGESTTVAIVLDIVDGWHTYWQNPGDSGAPISVDFRAPAGVEIGAIQWPAPERYVYSDGTALDYVYHDRAVLLASVRVGEDAAVGEALTIGVDVEYLVCKEVCIPGDASLEFAVTVGEASEEAPEAASLFGEARAAMPVDATGDVHVQWVGMTLMLEAQGAEGVRFYPLAPALAGPEDALRDGEGYRDTLSIVYPFEVMNTQQVEGVLEASIQGEKRLYTIVTEPPKRR